MSEKSSRRTSRIFLHDTAPLKPTGSERTRPARPVAEKRGNPLRQNLKITALAVAILMAHCTTGEAQELLTAGEIRNQIVGHNFQGRKGILSVSLHYASDGTVTMHSALGTGKGNWTLSGNSMCVKLETGPRRANECFTLVPQSDGGYRASTGMRLTPSD